MLTVEGEGKGDNKGADRFLGRVSCFARCRKSMMMGPDGNSDACGEAVI